jgi:hypothetical protein
MSICATITSAVREAFTTLLSFCCYLCGCLRTPVCVNVSFSEIDVGDFNFDTGSVGGRSAVFCSSVGGGGTSTIWDGYVDRNAVLSGGPFRLRKISTSKQSCSYHGRVPNAVEVHSRLTAHTDEVFTVLADLVLDLQIYTGGTGTYVQVHLTATLYTAHPMPTKWEALGIPIFDGGLSSDQPGSPIDCDLLTDGDPVNDPFKGGHAQLVPTYTGCPQHVFCLTIDDGPYAATFTPINGNTEPAFTVDLIDWQNPYTDTEADDGFGNWGGNYESSGGGVTDPFVYVNMGCGQGRGLELCANFDSNSRTAKYYTVASDPVGATWANYPGNDDQENLWEVTVAKI